MTEPPGAHSARPAGSADALLWAVHDLATAIAESDVTLGAVLGVSTGDFLAVKHVLLRPDELGPVELGRLLGMSSGSATTLVDRMEAAGHLERRPHPRDRRRRVLRVSASSRARVMGELEHRARAVEEVAAEYDEADRRTLTSFLAALAARHRRS